MRTLAMMLVGAACAGAIVLAGMQLGLPPEAGTGIALVLGIVIKLWASRAEREHDAFVREIDRVEGYAVQLHNERAGRSKKPRPIEEYQ